MPKGIYDRSKARRRTRRTKDASLSARIERLSKELASLSDEVKHVEGIQSAVSQYIAAAAPATNGRRGPGRPPGRRRGRPPGSKNRPKTEPVAAAAVTRRRPGRPRKDPELLGTAPRRRGRPRKVAAPA